MATALAAETAHRGRSTFLVDADPYGGAVAQHLGVLDEVSGLLAAARSANAGRLDAATLAGIARAVGPDGLRVLTGLPRPDRWSEVRAAAFEDVLDAATSLADLVVVDVGFSLEHDAADPFGTAPQRNQMTLAALERADRVLVVGAADPVGLARLARGLVDVHDRFPGLPGARRGQPQPADPGLVRGRGARHGRGLRRPGGGDLPARGPGDRRPVADGRPERGRARRLAPAEGRGGARRCRWHGRTVRIAGRSPRQGQAPKSR